ncbi:Zinc carboxypeptidase [Streptomyces sp. DvalAA-14]|uniref:M14 family zinc carboxypeptidase n=1 Tax=unclassified Streptomyces TaxID=2593676 RepID=UPI00081B969F|nr:MULTISPECIES: M14 family zinc carboxypeptidase [unclassified Streptomyces]MYS23360.1 hydroxylacyl-CoA dehydrogenase [Streptomyces sp. SID4948]SCE32177.1 Zinc carboxypeptidase [Streptomyces sp. DvalAA-14]
MRGPDAYPTVSGVAAAARLLTQRHPDLCRMRLAGESRAGRPLWLLSVGHGSRHVLVVAGAHPDEPAGGASVLWLAEQAVWDRQRHAEADLTWDFLLCLDPDGAVLNESGPAGARPPAVHFRHTFRPAIAEQPEWAGSLGGPGADLPESAALSAVIDALRPVLQCTLHGMDVGGGRIRLTADLPGLAEPFGKCAAELDVPVQTGTQDALAWDSPGPGVYVLPAEGPGRLAGGPAGVEGSTWCRPHRHGGTTAVVEVPMWATRRIADPAPHPDGWHTVAVLAARLRKDGATTAAALERTVALLGRVDEPLLRGAEDAAAAFSGLADDYEALAGHCPGRLTMAHVAALDIAARRVPLRASGMLLRLLDESRAFPADDPNAEPARLRSRLERRVDAGARDLVAALDARWVPVGTQAELQARMVLAAVERAGDERPGR